MLNSWKLFIRSSMMRVSIWTPCSKIIYLQVTFHQKKITSNNNNPWFFHSRLTLSSKRSTHQVLTLIFLCVWFKSLLWSIRFHIPFASCLDHISGVPPFHLVKYSNSCLWFDFISIYLCSFSFISLSILSLQSSCT
jgi:hypothetical protein